MHYPLQSRFQEPVMEKDIVNPNTVNLSYRRTEL